MKKIVTLIGAVLAMAIVGAPTISSAQATRTWVSGVGDDANPCSRTAPCKTFAGAISKTAAGGEISVLDPGGFGALTITKSITISTDPALGSILNALSNGVVINAASTDSITLRGLIISAPTTGASVGLNGVRILNAGTVNIVNCFIQGNKAAVPNGNGVLVVNTSGTVLLNVVNTVVSDNGNATAGGGIVVTPSGSGSVVVGLSKITAVNNSRGVRLESSATTGTVRGSLSDSYIANNTLAGISVVGTSTLARLTINDTVSANNGAGLNSNGASAVATINRSSFYDNTTGLQPVSSGQIQSYNNNAIGMNGTDGSPSSTIALH